ncbi:hypothetical protein E6H16_01035 [Candidatus Bathyarchaeota archaeon]|nr:MAG: hypothetical protein E6H16_01035 [Candidatus Bathyarchaeota archaeon]
MLEEFEDKLSREESSDLNRLLISSNPQDLIKFYSSFNDPKSLIDWMKNRPSGRAIIRPVDGNPDIVVVIPTADSNGKFASSCRGIFRGLQIVFVESGVGDPYFNYSRNCNLGLSHALSYNPKWIVLSNDDVIQIDNISALVTGLSNKNHLTSDVVFAQPPGRHHSYSLGIARNSYSMAIARSTYARNGLYALAGGYWRRQIQIEKKFHADFIIADQRARFSFLYKILFRFLNGAAFSIFNTNFVRKSHGKLFDETYINGVEDVDLFLQFANSNGHHSFVHFEIGTMTGASLGSWNITRRFRNIANEAYLNYKLRNRLLPSTFIAPLSVMNQELKVAKVTLN